MQKQVASVNTTVTGKLLADLGIAHNFSDSGIDSTEDDASIEAGTGDDTFMAALTVDFVQRFNFSATEGGAITFRSPHTSAEGYASMLVFDKAGAVMFLRLLPCFPGLHDVKVLCHYYRCIDNPRRVDLLQCQGTTKYHFSTCEDPILVHAKSHTLS